MSCDRLSDRSLRPAPCIWCVRLLSAAIGISGLLIIDVAAAAQAATADPARTLVERFQFTPADVDQVSHGQPVAKLLSTTGRDELAVVGALRMEGDMRRLVNWVRDIAAFRKAAELAHATVVTQPIADGAFAGFTLDPRDLTALRTCRIGACDIRLSEEALRELQRIRWDDPQSSEQASAILRQMLMNYAKAYLTGGDAALGNYHNQNEPRRAADDFHALLAGATNLKILVPELASYLETFPRGTLQGVDQLLYWTAVNDAEKPVFTLHHLVVYPRTAQEIIIADKTIYSSRSFEAAALVLSVQAATDGRGFFVVGAGRVKSARLSGVAARVLRSRIEKETVEGIKMYLGWIRDSLALPG